MLYTIHCDLLIKNKNTLFKCINLVSSNIANVPSQFHVIPGCDRMTSKSFKKIRRHNPCFIKLESV